ncbi:hypothetical protein [Actinoplanes sp. N902-109]|uniref:hypothetical protein n=1 Tax=Actinoplanes sp. (strain N902-109) TaxID=649831 RepID=UPI000329681E|nr:hypothetical protein [Actinoplanes sp. N902-109]AGL20861.1 hypothetical protein L083_7351 [Actinoplanes sp. N902-109]
MHTVELLLNPQLDKIVRGVWQHLHDQGLRSLATHTHATNSPHITLATTDVPILGAPLSGLPLDIVLDDVLTLGRNVAWRVRPTPQLRALHLAVWQSLDGTERNPLHAPQAWIPHVSLALRTDPAGYPRTLGEASGQAVSARTYDSSSRTVQPLIIPD